MSCRNQLKKILLYIPFKLVLYILLTCTCTCSLLTLIFSGMCGFVFTTAMSSITSEAMDHSLEEPNPSQLSDAEKKILWAKCFSIPLYLSEQENHNL